MLKLIKTGNIQITFNGNNLSISHLANNKFGHLPHYKRLTGHLFFFFLGGGGGGGVKPRGVLPYMGYIGMCGAKGYGFSAVLVINRVSLLAILPPFW